MAAEKNFETRLKKWLETKGIYALGTPQNKMTTPPVGYWEKRFANRMTKSGLPDMHISVNGHTLEIEVKAQNGKPSEMQLFMINQIRTSGAISFVLYPSAFKKFQSLIEDVIYDNIIFIEEVIWK